MKKISQAGIGLIKSFEGCRLTAYKPVAAEQYWTIGWGHYGPDVKQGQTITQAEADAMLLRDLERYVAYTNDKGNVPIIDSLTQNQFDALVSFCYNCGPGNLKKLCKGRTVAQIAASMPAYKHGADGKELAGLVRRRAAEVSLFNKIDEEDQPMNDAEKKALDALVKRVTDLEERAKKAEEQLAAATKLVLAPDWFVKEFGSADLNGLIDMPKKTVAAWENIAIAARLQGMGKGKKT